MIVFYREHLLLQIFLKKCVKFSRDAIQLNIFARLLRLTEIRSHPFFRIAILNVLAF